MRTQPKDFRYFFTYENVRRELVHAPRSWKSSSKGNYKRSAYYWGVIRSFALPLEFVLGGAATLKKAYKKYGYEAEVVFEMERLDRTTYQYLNVFKGDIDFSKIQEKRTSVIITLMEAGVSANVKAFENVKHEYDLVGDDTVTIRLPGVNFTETSQSIFNTSSPRSRFMPGTSLLTNFVSGVLETQSMIEQNANDGSFTSSSNWFLKSNAIESVRIQGRIKGTAINFFGDNGFLLRIMYQDGSGTTIATHVAGSGNTFDFPFDITLPLTPASRLFWYVRANNVSSDIVISEGDFTCMFSATSPATNHRGIKPFDLFKRIINRISPGSAVKSFMLQNDWQNLIILSGDSIRNIADAKIKISFKEFFDSFNGIDDTGYGNEGNTAVIERAPYFSRPLLSLDVGTVKDCVYTVAEDFIFNSFKIGYDDGDTEEQNGREEYNSLNEFQNPIVKIQQEKSFVSPILAGQFEIEDLRVRVIKKENIDTSSDNKNFMVFCENNFGIYQPILGSSYQSVTGLTSPETAYNLEITPMQNLKRHGARLRSILDKMDGRYITFASGRKNTELSTVKGGVYTAENANTLVSSLPEKYFRPEIATFKCNMPREAFWLINTLPYGYIQFNDNGVSLRGYFLDVEIDLAKKAEQELTLLLTPDSIRK